MRPETYRKANYNSKIKMKQNNFYNGLLSLSQLSKIAEELTTQDVYQTQKEWVQMYNNTIVSQKALLGLNKDILAFKMGTSQFLDDNISVVNQINQGIDTIRNQYSPSISALRKMSNDSKNNQEKAKALIQQLEQLFVQYSILLKQIETSSVNANGLVDNRISSNLQVIQTKIESMKMAVAGVLQGNYEGLNENLGGNFYAISSMAEKLKGVTLENEFVEQVSEYLPENIKVFGTGTIYLGGKELSIDSMAFNQDILNSIKISYEVAAPGSTKKSQKQGTLQSFFDDMSQNRQNSFHINYSTFKLLCEQSLATIQAKAIGTKTTKMYIARNVQLFEPIQKNIANYTIPSFTSTYLQVKDFWYQAIIGLADLYHLSKAEKKRKESNYIQSHRQYQMLINMALSRAVNKLLANNQYLLSNRFGLISFVDFFSKYGQVYFSWGTNITANLTKLNNSRHIFLMT